MKTAKAGARPCSGSWRCWPSLAAFAVLDWYPTVKDLGRLRRERGDLERKIRDYARHGRRRSSSPTKRRKRSWRSARPSCSGRCRWWRTTTPGRRIGPVGSAVRGAGLDHIPMPGSFQRSRSLDGTRDSAAWRGRTPWLDWIGQEIRQISEAADCPGRAAFPGTAFSPAWNPARGNGWPAGRWASPWQAPLPALLDFINHVSWGETRLEIVRLHLEPGPALCRGLAGLPRQLPGAGAVSPGWSKPGPDEATRTC